MKWSVIRLRNFLTSVWFLWPRDSLQCTVCLVWRCRNVSRIVWSFLIIPLLRAMTRHHSSQHSYSAMVALVPAAVTQNPVTRCHETFALQEFLNKRCHEDFIQIVRREYHYHRLSPSVISNNTTHRAHLTITMSLQCLASVDQSGLSKPLSTNQITRSGPGLHLAAILAAHGEAAPSLTSRHWMLSHSDIPPHKNCIEIHLSTRLSEVLSERVSFSQNKHEKFIFSLNAKVKVHVSCGEGKSKLYRPQVRRISRQMAPSLKSNLCRRGVMHNLPATWRYNQFKIEIFFLNLHPKPAIFVIIQVTMWRIALTV